MQNRDDVVSAEHLPYQRSFPPSEVTDVEDDFQMQERKRLHLNANGILTGSMALCYHRDLAAFAKELNPAAKGWQGQTEEARKRFIRWINAEYRFVGIAFEVSE